MRRSDRAASDPSQSGGGGELRLLASFLNPTDAFILQARLRADGLEAVVADAEMVQTYSLLAIALGGVRVLVPDAHFSEAQEIQTALERGDYMLDEAEPPP